MPSNPPQTQAAEAARTGPVGRGAYVVKSGDGMESIAYAHGFFWQTLWDDPANAELKEVRKDPNVLLPGDLVTIMAKRLKTVEKADTQRHRFRRKGVPHVLKVQFLDWKGEPRANKSARINVDGTLSDGTTDGDGLLEIPMSPGARTAVVRFESGHEFEIDLGHLDPVSEARGVQQRLRNLGYYTGPVDGKLDQENMRAITRFQSSVGLPATGEVDDLTRDRLVAENGA